MNNIELQKINLAKDRKSNTLKLQESVKDIEDKLKNMGIERPYRGPRISDPAHNSEMKNLFR